MLRITLAVALFVGARALNNGLGLTPQMGWNTWNKFGCSISDQLIRDSADKIVELGLDQLGYKYVNIDDCWMEVNRTSDGHFIVDATAFPNGMKAVGDYIHSKGLLFGIYSSAGTYTCQGRAGSLGHEVIDAQDWASWGVDYLKYDNCYNENLPAMQRYPPMRDALNQTGRPIFYSICNWGQENTPTWAPQVGNSWRTTGDIMNFWSSVERNFRYNGDYPQAAGPGAWNDPDMLEIGNGGLTEDQEKSHFALWAIAKAPLIIGCDLTAISNSSLAILKNQALIAINQDSLGVQGTCKKYCTYVDWLVNNPQIYAGPLSNGDTVVVVINWGVTNSGDITFNLSEVGISYTNSVVTDLWTGNNSTASGSINVSSLPPYGNAALRISQAQSELPTLIQ